MERREESVGTRDLVSAPESVGRDDESPPERRDEETEARHGGTAAGDESGAQRDRGAATTAEIESTPLLPANESDGFGRRWEEIQTAFVDEPRRAVEEADQLVASVMQRLADGFAREREHLEGQWSRGEDVSTEDLRLTLQRYRSFFRRLLSA